MGLVLVFQPVEIFVPAALNLTGIVVHFVKTRRLRSAEQLLHLGVSGVLFGQPLRLQHRVVHFLDDALDVCKLFRRQMAVRKRGGQCLRRRFFAQRLSVGRIAPS